MVPNKLWKILKEMEILDHLTCLLRNLDASQEATVRTGHGWNNGLVPTGKGVRQGCILSPCLFNLYAVLLLFSCPVMSDSLRPHRLQHTRPPCPSPSARIFPSSCSLHWWCHPVISSSDNLFSFCPQSFPASGTFPMSWLFTSDDQNPGASALPVNI